MSLNEVSLPLGRRFRALKLWAVLRCLRPRGPAGDDPRARPPARSSSRAGCATSRAGRSRAPRRFSLVCFRRDGSDEENEALLARVNARGRVFLSHTRLDGRYVLRLAIGNARTTEDDVRLAWDELNDREAAWTPSASSAASWSATR